METLLTAKLVDDITDTRSHKNRESWALGVANILAGFYGGIAGCAMIGQTIVNVKMARARTRISTFVAGLVLLAMVTLLSDVMAQIPMVALAAVMMIVAITTVDWHSVRPSTLRRMPVPETLVMAVTIVVVVATGNLAIGVLVGVVLAMVLFARRVAHVISVTRVVAEAGPGPGAGSDSESGLGSGLVARYAVHGPLFFGSSNDLVERFSYASDPPTVVIDFSDSQIWDASSVAALDSVVTKYRQHGITATVEGLDGRSSVFHGRLSGHLG
jgi:SulP family sulfate permease